MAARGARPRGQAGRCILPAPPRQPVQPEEFMNRPILPPQDTINGRSNSALEPIPLGMGRGVRRATCEATAPARVAPCGAVLPPLPSRHASPVAISPRLVARARQGRRRRQQWPSRTLRGSASDAEHLLAVDSGAQSSRNWDSYAAGIHAKYLRNLTIAISHKIDYAMVRCTTTRMMPMR
jgi:hypothetical protein